MATSFRALKNRNYRLYFSGQLISVIGNGMQMMVQAWLVYRITHSAAWLGIVAACSQVTAFIFSPLAGVIADHRDRRKILIAFQALGMAQSFTLAGLIFAGTIQAWQIAVLAVVLGLVNAFETTTRHAFSVDLVGREDLASAIGLNSATINCSRVLGPALGGLLIAPLGEGWCFLINGLSYIAVIYGLMAMDFRGVPREKNRLSDSWQHLGEAIRYLKRTPRILDLIALAAFVAFAGFSFTVLLPVVAKEVLHGNAGTLAWLTSSSGLGAMLGAVVLGTSGQAHSVARRVYGYLVLVGAGFMLLGFSHTLLISALAMFIVGCFMMGTFPVINSSIQFLVEDRMRGRVMSLYTMTFFGATPLGSLLAGYLSDRHGSQAVALGIGILCLVFGTLASFAIRYNEPASPRCNENGEPIS